MQLITSVKNLFFSNPKHIREVKPPIPDHTLNTPAFLHGRHQQGKKCSHILIGRKRSGDESFFFLQLVWLA